MVVVVLEQKMVEVLSNENWAQLSQVTGLIAKKALTNVPAEY